jgi:hypothetical protein
MKALKNGTAPEGVNHADVDGVMKALSGPFEPTEVRFKPAVVSGSRALALAYVDARAIQDRLDDVLGVAGWQDDYELLPDGSVVCRLRLRLGGEWITKVDVGGPSEQPDGGDRLKAAFSDSLKRAAVKFGIGRYLYRLPSRPEPAEAPAPVRAPATGPSLPANGTELERRLQDYESRLVAMKVCQPGELFEHVRQAGVKRGQPADLAQWKGSAIAKAVDDAKTFGGRPRQGEAKEVA